MAFARGESAGQRTMFSLTGLVTVVLGVVFAIRPDIGAVTIALVYGMFSIVWGVSALVTAANTRRVGHGLVSAAHGHGCHG